MYCNKCGAKILDNSSFCNKCGHKIEKTNTKTLNNEEQDKIYTQQSGIEKEQKNKTKYSKKKTIIWIICSILLAGILLSIYIINDIHQTAEQDQMNELRTNIVKQYNTLGISKTVQDYMNLSKEELQEELEKISKQVDEFIELNKKYESIIANVDYIDYKFKLGDMGYQKIDYNTGNAVVVIPKKVVKTDKIFHINTLTDKVDTIWCIVEFSYDYTNGTKLRTGTNTLIGNLKIDVETENVTVYSPLDFDNGVVTYSDLYMPAENHIIAMKNTAHNYVIYPYKFYTRETVQMLFGNQLPENKQSNSEISKDDNSNNEINSDDNINNTTISDNDYSNNNAIDNTNIMEREQLLNNFDFYNARGFIFLTEKERQELETFSDTELKERLDKIEENIKIRGEYNNKYSDKLNEIFGKEINVELKSSEDIHYTYMPSNNTQPKAQVEYVAINENGIGTIYYSVEMDLTITDKKQNNEEKITTKKYYKANNINELNGTIKIDNYNTQAVQDEMNNAFSGKSIMAHYATGDGYNFYNAEKHLIYRLPYSFE